MTRRSLIVTCFAALFAVHCGGAAVPTSPTLATNVPASASFAGQSIATRQSPTGAWRGFVRSTATRAGLNTTVGFALSCSQRWEISSQSAGHFEGRMWSQGSSPETDWRCIQEGTFTGEVAADDRLTISFSPRLTVGGCNIIAGGETATGRMSRDSMVVDLPYRATCEMAPGGAAPSWDLEISATITLTPW
jgi:hypothetical protein